MPSRSKTGSSSSSDFRNCASACSAASGRPLNSVLMVSTPEVDGDLDGPLPGPDRGLPLVLPRPGPAQHRQQRGDPHPGVRRHLLQLAHPGVVDPRVLEERDEVGLGRQLHPGVARGWPRRRAAPRRCGGEEHLRVERQLHSAASRSGAVIPAVEGATPAAPTGSGRPEHGRRPSGRSGRLRPRPRRPRRRRSRPRRPGRRWCRAGRRRPSAAARCRRPRRTARRSPG